MKRKNPEPEPEPDTLESVYNECIILIREINYLFEKEEKMFDRLLEFKKKNKVESRRTKKHKK